MLQYRKIMFFMKNKDDSLDMHPTKSVLYSESQENTDLIPFLKKNHILLETQVLGDWLLKAEIINQKMMTSFY